MAQMSPTVVAESLTVAMVSMASATVRAAWSCLRRTDVVEVWDMGATLLVDVASRHRGQEHD